LRKAVENITGTPIIAKKSAIIAPPYEIIDRGFSRFDRFKMNMPINDLLDKDFSWPGKLLQPEL
jgi:hypothetical protein